MMRYPAASATAICLWLAVLGGCQSREQGWSKPGASVAELNRDLKDCKRIATGPGPFHFDALNRDYEGARDHIRAAESDCMKARGWSATGPT